MGLGRATLALAIMLLPAACSPLAAKELPWTEHQVRQGETLDSIAGQYCVDSSCISWANELAGDVIPPGEQTLLVPRSDGFMLETLAEVRARRKGETTADLYLAEEDRSAPIASSPGPPRKERFVSEYPGFEGLLALARGSAAEAAAGTLPQLSWPVDGVVFRPSAQGVADSIAALIYRPRGARPSARRLRGPSREPPREEASGSPSSSNTATG